ADEDAAGAAAIGDEAPAQAVGGSLPGVDVVETDKAIGIAKIGVVELAVAAVCVRNVAEVALVGRSRDGGDGLDHFVPAVMGPREGIAPFDRQLREEAGGGAHTGWRRGGGGVG